MSRFAFTLSVLFVVACGLRPASTAAQEGPLPGEPASAARADADSELLAAWWNACAMVDAGEAWSACRMRLEQALDEFGESGHADGVRQLVASLELAEARAAPPAPVDASSSIDELVAALPDARVDFQTVMLPYQYHAAAQVYQWDYFAASAVGAEANPAALLVRRGREALPALVALLDDDGATRSAVVEAEGLHLPQVFQVRDLALSMIGGITGCTFHGKSGQNAVLSSWTDAEQTATVGAVREWFAATRDMTPADAVMWLVRRSQGVARERMLDRLVRTGQGAAALDYLLEHFHEGPKLDLNLALLTLQAGSRAPLDWVHQKVAGGALLDRAMVRLTAQAGDVADFKLLADEVSAATARHDRAALLELQTIVTELMQVEDRRTVPVMVAVIAGELDRLDVDAVERQERVDLPNYADLAAQHVQMTSGVQFGFDPQAAAPRRVRVYRDIVEWWRREGCGAYDFVRNAPHAPGGIR